VTAPQRLADLPFADTLQPFEGELGRGGEDDYDAVHFDGAVFDEVAVGGGRFMDCAFESVQFDGGRLRGARFSDVWFHDSRLISTDLAQTEWTDSSFVAVSVAGVQAYEAQLRRVVFERCKFDSLNLRAAKLFDVTFDNCLLRDVDFGGASLTRVSFPNSRLVDADLTKVTCEHLDLRGAQLGISAGHDALRGAIIDSGQLVDLAPALAQSLGITVADF